MKHDLLRAKHWVNDIFVSYQNILTDIGPLTDVQYMADGKTQRAVLRGLTDIGEASKRIAESPLLVDYISAELRKHLILIYSMRCKLVHGYDSVNHSVVLQTIKADLPVFLDELKRSALMRIEEKDDPGDAAAEVHRG